MQSPPDSKTGPALVVSANQYREPLPEVCPPVSAFPADGRSAWRAVAHNSPVDSDFDSLAKTDPQRFNGRKDSVLCKARAVSLFENKEEARLISKLPKKEHLNHLAKVELSIGTGHISTSKKDTHISWWIYKSAVPTGQVLEVEIA